MPLDQDSKESLEQGLPFIRSILAFIVQIRLPEVGVTYCYEQADKFIKQLKEDINK